MINYELKHANPPTVSTDIDGEGTTSVVIGFTSGAVGCPLSYGMIAGDTIQVLVANAGEKTQNQIDTEVMAAVNAFIVNKYPST